MSIEVTCSGCGRRLNVDSNFSGKRARCPKCQRVFDVPDAAEPVDAVLANEDEDSDQESGFPNFDAPPSFMPDIRKPAASKHGKVPHRGVPVLILGVLSWMVCPLLGIAAWMMGSSDLNLMKLDRMDKSGHDITRIGMILGILSLIFSIIVFVVILLFVMADVDMDVDI